MQSTVILSLLGISLFASMAVAQIPAGPVAGAVPPVAAGGVVPPIPPIGLGIPPIGLGIPPFMGFPFFPPFLGPWGGLGLFGPFGLGLGFGRFGLGLGLGLGRFGGLGFRGGFRRGRDVSEVEEMTFCHYNSEDNLVKCHGVNNNFECKVTPHFGDLKSATYNVQNLTVVPDVVSHKKVEHQIYNLFSVQPKVGELNDFTLIEKPDRHVTFSLWHSSEVVKRTGLRFVEEKCWKSFETMMTEPESVQFSLHIAHEPVAKKLRQ